jgi:hypothetical protein
VRWSGDDEFLDHRVVLTCLDDVFLTGEIAEERHMRHTSGRGDVFDRCVVVAIGGEQA